VNGFSIREETFFLFREEYKVPLLPPDLAAYLATIGEHVFSVLLLVGLASRLSALGLFGMTMVIQLFVFPDGRPEHILWVALQLLIISRGPGAVSLDHLIWDTHAGHDWLRPSFCCGNGRCPPFALSPTVC
jgi:putative oxidoreductase